MKIHVGEDGRYQTGLAPLGPVNFYLNQGRGRELIKTVSHTGFVSQDLNIEHLSGTLLEIDIANGSGNGTDTVALAIWSGFAWQTIKETVVEAGRGPDVHLYEAGCYCVAASRAKQTIAVSAPFSFTPPGRATATLDFMVRKITVRCDSRVEFRCEGKPLYSLRPKLSEKGVWTVYLAPRAHEVVRTSTKDSIFIPSGRRDLDLEF